MVNTGQPSNACIQCRFRRIKCDATKPHCERCTLYGVVCPGYPERSLVFRNDTTLVRERAERKYEKKRRVMRRDSSSDTFSSATPTPPSESSPSVENESQSTRPITSLALLQPHETEIVAKAVGDFLSQWTNPNVELWWDILNPTILTSLEPFTGECLSTALQATSVMTVASRTGFQNQELMRTAAKMYGSALRSINLALQSPTECIQDNTILAVTLTALFESMQEDVDDSLTTAHLRGMMSMVNARGPDQFKTVAGQRIFLFAYFSWTSNAMPDMIISPEKSNELIPPLSEQLADMIVHPISDEPAFTLLPLIQKSILLRSTSTALLTTASSSRDPHTPLAILSDIDTIDTSLLAWNSSLPPGWGTEDHLYQLLTTSWFRTHRIFLADLAIRCYQLLASINGDDTAHDREIWKRIDAAQSAIDEICVRTPYTFSPHDKPELRKPDVTPRTIPSAGLTYLYHSSFDYPLLIASMVGTLPPFRQQGIAQARIESAKACGLKQPRKRYPKALVLLGGEERERYIKHRVERHQEWLAKMREKEGPEWKCPFREGIEGHDCGDGSEGQGRSEK